MKYHKIPSWSQCIRIEKEKDKYRMQNISTEVIDYMTEDENVQSLWPGNYAIVNKQDLLATLSSVCYDNHFSNGCLSNGEIVFT